MPPPQVVHPDAPQDLTKGNLQRVGLVDGGMSLGSVQSVLCWWWDGKVPAPHHLNDARRLPLGPGLHDAAEQQEGQVRVAPEVHAVDLRGVCLRCQLVREERAGGMRAYKHARSKHSAIPPQKSLYTATPAPIALPALTQSTPPHTHTPRTTHHAPRTAHLLEAVLRQRKGRVQEAPRVVDQQVEGAAQRGDGGGKGPHALQGLEVAEPGGGAGFDFSQCRRQMDYRPGIAYARARARSHISFTFLEAVGSSRCSASSVTFILSMLRDAMMTWHGWVGWLVSVAVLCALHVGLDWV